MNLFRYAVLTSALSAFAFVGAGCAADSGGFGDDGGDDSTQVVPPGLDAATPLLDGSGFDSGVVVIGDSAAQDAAFLDALAPDATAQDASTLDMDGGGLTDTTQSDVTVADTGAPDAADLDTSIADTSLPDTSIVDATLPDDTTVADTSIPDVSIPDVSTPDTSVPDTSVPDVSTPDTSVPDTSVPDTSTPDTSIPDTSTPDTSTADTSTVEAGGSCLSNIPATCPNCQTTNASDKPACEAYLACYLAQSCNPADACGSNDGVCGVNTIGGGSAPQTAAVATYNCACP